MGIRSWNIWSRRRRDGGLGAWGVRMYEREMEATEAHGCKKSKCMSV